MDDMEHFKSGCITLRKVSQDNDLNEVPLSLSNGLSGNMSSKKGHNTTKILSFNIQFKRERGKRTPFTRKFW